MNAVTDEDIRILREGDVLDLSALGNPQLSIRAVTAPINIDRIDLLLYGFVSSSELPFNHTQTESQWPYAFFGGNRKAGSSRRDYIGRALPAGKYSLTANPISIIRQEILPIPISR